MTNHGAFPRAVPLVLAERKIDIMDMVERHAFINRLRVLVSLDGNEVPFLIGPNWQAFRTDPFRFLMRADDETAAAIWEAVERPHNASVLGGERALR